MLVLAESQVVAPVPSQVVAPVPIVLAEGPESQVVAPVPHSCPHWQWPRPVQRVVFGSQEHVVISNRTTALRRRPKGL